MKPGIHNIDEAAYHADPCPEPSLSSSIATTMIDESPIHAWTKHPKLNPDYEAEERGIFDIGSAAHAIVLEGRDMIEVIDAPDWRTKAAKESRDAARDNGMIPLLERDDKNVRAMVDAFYQQVRGIPALADAMKSFEAERTIVWQERGIWCRCRPDILPSAGPLLLDYKTTGGSAHPQAWASSRLYEGPDIQAEFYLRGCRAVGIKKRQMVFIVQETKPPFALSAVSPTPEGMDAARHSVDRAMDMWRRCLERDSWPGFPSEIFYAEPSWRSDKRRSVASDLEAAVGRDALDLAIQMQAPIRSS
jgi:hypothetical protein